LNRRTAPKLMQAALRAADLRAEGIRKPLAVAKMVTICEHDLDRRLSPLEPLEPLAGDHWVEDHSRKLEIVRVHRHRDSGMNGGPVMDAWKDFTHGPVRDQLERKRTHEERPRRARELRPLTDRTEESLEWRHSQAARRSARSTVDSALANCIAPSLT